ncbi:MAG TPA: choice-of-anchor tandem repeat GloVer-containing protein [Terriglobales bacterium]
MKNQPVLFAVILLLAALPAFAASEKVLHSFKGTDGTIPYGSLVFDSGGNLYGTAAEGGAHGTGAVFTMVPSGGKWTEKVIHSFSSSAQDGASPEANLVFDANGNLYGTTTKGGTHSDGVIFELLPSGGKWSEKILMAFDGTDGSNPVGGVIFDGSGKLYGPTFLGGSKKDGIIFSLVLSSGQWTEKVLHTFNGGDGANPWGSLVLGPTGRLFGAAAGDGVYKDGAVFELVPAAGKWTEKVAHSFDFANLDGANPYGTLIADANGNLYGTTVNGGQNNSGTVFELSPKVGGGWTETILYDFQNNGTDGILPYGGLLLDSAGNLYGTTYQGGAHSDGTVFELSLSSGVWTETVLYSFNGASGANPFGGLILDSAGNLYGSTSAGGANGKGVVFEIIP